MRARMALSISKQTCEVRELVLRNKPTQMLEISPKGTVPVLQTREGQVIEESLEVMLWALRQNDPEYWLLPEQPEQLPERGDEFSMLDLIGRCEVEFKPHLDRYKYANRYHGVNPIDHRTKAEDFIAELDNRLRNGIWLFGSRPALADYAIAPFIRQFANTDVAWFSQAPYPYLHKWLNQILVSEPFLSIMEKLPVWKPGDQITYRY